MERKESVREAPRAKGRETEFFLQNAVAQSVSCKAHIHRAVELLYIKNGNYNVILDGAEYFISEGDLILFCSDCMHHVTAGECEKNDYYVIKIPPSFFLEASGEDEGSRYVMQFMVSHRDAKFLWRKSELESSPILEILNSLIYEYETKGYAYKFAIRLKIMELLLAVMRERNVDPDLLQSGASHMIYDAITYVRSNFAQDINEKELAEEMGLSYSYFSRSFKRVMGMSFKKYLNMIRVNRAEQMLITGDHSVSEVAIECGYNSISYFISVYRSLKGTTPFKTAMTGSPTVK